MQKGEIVTKAKAFLPHEFSESQTIGSDILTDFIAVDGDDILILRRYA